jgi:hypothetical protein
MTPAEKPPEQPRHITPEQEADYRSADATVAWLLRQPGSFFRHHAGKWIAARDCQIVAVADNDRELMAQIDRTDLPRTLIHRVERPGRAIYQIPTNLSAPALPFSYIFDLFGKAPRLRSADDIEAQMREERDAWDEP